MIVDSETLLPRFEALLGPAWVGPAEGPTWSVDGAAPRVVVRPGDAEQIAAVLRLCAESPAAVTPRGGGTAMDVGNPPRAVEVVLLTERLARVVDYDHANLTVTVQSGATLGALAEVLAGAAQWLPLEPPRAEHASAGGAAAVNLNGPRRMMYGAARDLTIGMRAALADGSIIKWGGKTVKNVAGYDMCKLFVGSMGTLGVLTELTLKVYPLPEISRTFVVGGADAGVLTALAGNVLGSPLLPSAVTMVNVTAGALIGRTTGALCVRAEGLGAAVDRHQRDIQAWASRAGLETDVLTGEAERGAWKVLRDAGWLQDEVAIRLSVTSGAVPRILGEMTVLLPAAARVVAHVASGIIWVAIDAPDASPALLPALRDLARRHEGHVLLARAPRSLKADDVWFPTPQALPLMRGLKQSFDPQNILNPGRFITGL